MYNYLLKRGALPVDPQVALQNRFIEAAGNGDIAKMKMALEEGARIDGKSSDGRTALNNALRNPLYEEVNLLAVL